MIRRSSWFLFLPAIAACLACSDSSAVAPTALLPRLLIGSVAVSVDGQDVTNGVYHQGLQDGQLTRFEARVVRADGTPMPGQPVYVDFRHPEGGHGPGGGHHQGRFALYDDGSHGDHAPDDGRYAFEDHPGDYGFHHHGSHQGTFRYEFFCLNPDGSESERQVVNVQVMH